MKKVLLSFLFLSSTSVYGFSENFVCSWQEDNKINQLVLKRLEREQGGDLFEISGDLDFGAFDSDYFEVVDENKNGLTLIEERYPKGSEKWLGSFEVIILNKLFTYTTTWIYNPSKPKVISGKCLIM